MTSTPNTSPASERVPEMVERVAKAICCPDGICDGPDREGGCACDFQYAAARAAIAAMREPTEAMLEVAYEHSDPKVHLLSALWQAAIDEALR